MEVSKNITEGTVNEVSDINEYKPGKKLLNFRLKTDDEYSTMLEFTIFNDKIDKHLPKLVEGNKLKVQYNIKGNDYNGRIYHSLTPWSIELLNGNELEPQVKQDVNRDLDEDVPF